MNFVHKHFQDLEIKWLNLLATKFQCSYLGKRYGAKEAVAKAEGTSIGEKLAFKDIMIVNNEAGAPKLIIPPDLYTGIDQYNFYIPYEMITRLRLHL